MITNLSANNSPSAIRRYRNGWDQMIERTTAERCRQLVLETAKWYAHTGSEGEWVCRTLVEQITNEFGLETLND